MNSFFFAKDTEENVSKIFEELEKDTKKYSLNNSEYKIYDHIEDAPISYEEKAIITNNDEGSKIIEFKVHNIFPFYIYLAAKKWRLELLRITDITYIFDFPLLQAELFFSDSRIIYESEKLQKKINSNRRLMNYYLKLIHYGFEFDGMTKNKQTKIIVTNRNDGDEINFQIDDLVGFINELANVLF